MKKLVAIFLSLFTMFGLIYTPPIVKADTTPSGTYGTDYVKYGDVDINGTVDVTDALFVLQSSVDKIKFTAKEQSIADVELNLDVTAGDALIILQFSVDKITGFTDEYYIDKVGGGSNGASADNIPDKYQMKVTFKISGGKWSDGTTADIVQYKTLIKNGKYDVSASATLTAPTGMTANSGYSGGAWNTTVPTTVSGTADVTYTYSYSLASVNYTVNHYKLATNSTYSSTPTATETKTGKVGDTVTATANAKTYTGYSVDTSKTATSIKLQASNNVLNIYYGISSTNYISDYSKTNAVNGAYTKDTTADNSFSVNINTLKPYTLYRVSESAMKRDGSNLDNDCSRLFYSLQGLVNRDFGMDAKHTTVIYANAQGGTEDTWLNYINSTDSILRKSSAAGNGDGLTIVNITTWSDFYNQFKDVIKSCGIVLWDGNVPATANVAATMCGVDGYLPVLAESPLHKILVADGVSVKHNFVGQFKNGQGGVQITGGSNLSTGSAKNDAYLWAVEKYINRVSSTYMGYMVDGAASLKGYSAYPDHESATLIRYERWKQLYNHDYLIARRAFFFDLDPYAGEAAFDDPAQVNGQASVGADAATLKYILQRRYNRANGAFGQLIGFPPWWCKYSKDFELGTQPATYLEWLFTETITCYNMAKEADAAGMTAMTNGSAYYKYVLKKAKYTNNTTPLENLTFNKNTFYYTIYVGDYDSSAWLKTLIPGYFGDSKRGTLPLMWSINPNLSYRVPMVFDYMYEKKTAKDYFAGGDGGAGYIIPEALFHDKYLAYLGEKRPANNAAAGVTFANYSKPFYDRFGLEMTGFIINGAQHYMTENIAKHISMYSPKLNFTNCHNTPLVKYNSTYFVHCHNGVTTGQSVDMYNHARSVMASGLNFSAYRTVDTSPTKINQIVTEFNSYASSKGLSAKYVDPYTYYNILKQSEQGVGVNATKDLIVNFDSTSRFSGDFDTTIAIEGANKTQGTGALRADFKNVAGNASTNQIGGMVRYSFSSAINLSSYKDISFDYWFSDAVTGSA
ncbi:MAG: hypothetical protein IKT35_02170, partial [Clostridia bacterium]|nr:hypothetical protein [Clostridia bacterium]